MLGGIAPHSLEEPALLPGFGDIQKLTTAHNDLPLIDNRSAHAFGQKTIPVLSPENFVPHVMDFPISEVA